VASDIPGEVRNRRERGANIVDHRASALRPRRKVFETTLTERLAEIAFSLDGEALQGAAGLERRCNSIGTQSLPARQCVLNQRAADATTW